MKSGICVGCIEYFNDFVVRQTLTKILSLIEFLKMMMIKSSEKFNTLKKKVALGF